MKPSLPSWNRDLGGSLTEFITLIRPDIFSMLMEHDKLMNVQFNGGNGNSMVGRRVAELNGMRVMETPRFPHRRDCFALPRFRVQRVRCRC